MAAARRTPEGAVVDACMRVLTALGWDAWLTPTQGVYDESKRSRRKASPWVRRGAPDAVAISNGAVLFIEFKAPDGRQSEHQEKFERMVKRQGHKYLLVRSVDELLVELTRCGIRESRMVG